MATTLTVQPSSPKTIDANASTLWPGLLLMLPFLMFFYAQLIHHTLWRDEINAWGLVVASPTLGSLFENVHYEAHPALWYLLLYPFSKLTHAPWMMKLVEAGVGTVIYLVFGLSSPLRRSEQMLVYLNFFVLFEYTVMSRMYGVMFLIALVYLHERARRPDRVVRNALWLGLMGMVDVTGMILSGGLAIEYVLDLYSNGKLRKRDTLKKYLAALVAYGGLLAVSTCTLLPARDISWRSTGRMFSKAGDLIHFEDSLLSYLTLPWYLINRVYPKQYWNAQVMEHPSLYLLLTPFTVFAVIWTFRRTPRFLAMMGAIAAVGTAFADLVYLGSLRHFGIMFIAFLAGMWILRTQGQRVSRMAYVLLITSALGGLSVAVDEWFHPFSDDYAAAEWLRAHHLQNATLIGTPDTHVVGVAELLAKPMYFLDCQCVDTYMKFANRRDEFDPDTQIASRLDTAVRELHKPEMVFVMNRAFSPMEAGAVRGGGIDARLLAQFTEGDVADEHYFLYKVTSEQPGK